LSISRYGGGGVVVAFAVTTSFGPKAPMCSQIVDEPGPPL
jgi:hypothetical protein